MTPFSNRACTRSTVMPSRFAVSVSSSVIRSVALGALVDEPPAAFVGADIGVDADGAAAELDRDLLDARAVARADRDLRALTNELRRDRAPEPLAGRGDEDAPAGETEVHGL